LDKFFCPRGPGADSPFHAPFNGEASWREDGTCSYCGSLKPELLFQQIEKGAELGPTDKSYKAYVKLVDHSVRGAGKFYFQHLSFEEKMRFIDLWNDGKLNIGFPGHFYVLPFFMQLRSSVAS
jgi:hypothetical protein